MSRHAGAEPRIGRTEMLVGPLLLVASIFDIVVGLWTRYPWTLILGISGVVAFLGWLAFGVQK